MIKEKELLEAIDECHEVQNPTANTCRNLAAYYTILDHVREQEIPKGYSYSAGHLEYSSTTEFGRIISKCDANKALELMDELMTTIEVIQPRLYDAVIMKLKEM